MVPTPYVSELLHRLRMADPQASVEVDAEGRAWLRWQGADQDAPLTLVVTEQDLAAAVRSTGEICRDALWPRSTVDAAGFNLLLVHVDEVVATRDVTAPLRITAKGLQWPGYPP